MAIEDNKAQVDLMLKVLLVKIFLKEKVQLIKILKLLILKNLKVVDSLLRVVAK